LVLPLPGQPPVGTIVNVPKVTPGVADVLILTVAYGVWAAGPRWDWSV
jgi:hypothetical protein